MYPWRTCRKARRGKAHYKEVQWVNENELEALTHIQHLLISGTFRTSSYTVEHAMKGDKMRTIHKLPYYPDRIVQHAVVNVCSPFWIRSMIRDTYQSIPGRGTTDCFKRACRTGKKQALPSYYGWIKHANTKRLWYKHTGCHQWKLS